MNVVLLCGRLVRDPEIRYISNEAQTAVAHYTLAVPRSFKKSGDGANQEADFIRITAFGHSATFAEKYLRKGVKINVTGHIQTGSYTNRDGQKVYTTDVIVSGLQELCESRSANRQPEPEPATSGDIFMNIPDGIDEELPFA